MSLMRTVLAIADNARHPCNNSVAEPAVYNSAVERAAVEACESWGYMQRVSTARGETWSRITPEGVKKLASLRGDP